jgi:hypothetical protein
LLRHNKTHDKEKIPPPTSDFDLECGIEPPKLKKKYKNRKPDERLYTLDFKCTYEGCKKRFLLENCYEAHIKTHKGECVSI